ncbi:MAG: LytTR family DNA-binding domain-containing protein [Saprospiraceae bacterium]
MKAIIVEDNPGAINVLKSLLKEYPGGVELCGVAQSLETARKLILDEQPDLWLLDIRLHDKLIFSLMKELGSTVVDRAIIIFLTAYYEPEYIHEALKIAALDFLVKPIDRDQLFSVLDKAKERLIKTDLLSRITKLEENVKFLDTRAINTRVPIHRVSGDIDYEDKRMIIYIITENEITRLLLQNDRFVSTTKTLKFYEELLEGDNTFLRVSKQIILNLEFLKSFNPKTDSALLTDGSSIQISRRKSSELIQILSGQK